MDLDRYVFDSYAILCFFQDEPGAETIENLLRAAAEKKCEIYLSIINLAEIFYIISREYGEQEAIEKISLLRSFPIHIVDVTFDEALAAARIKSRYSIALGDSFAISLARQKDASVVTGDPEFKLVEKEIKVLWLHRET